MFFDARVTRPSRSVYRFSHAAFVINLTVSDGFAPRFTTPVASWSISRMSLACW